MSDTLPVVPVKASYPIGGGSAAGERRTAHPVAINARARVMGAPVDNPWRIASASVHYWPLHDTSTRAVCGVTPALGRVLHTHAPAEATCGNCRRIIGTPSEAASALAARRAS